jgi:hypothetical protein
MGGAIYDWFAYYKPAFAAGVAFNLLNLVFIGGLLLRGKPPRAMVPVAHAA